MSGDPRLKRTQPGGSAVTAAARASDARQAVRDRTAVTGNAVEALRSALYFGGAGMLRPVLVLCAWIGAGIALLGLDTRRHRRAALAEAEREIQDPPTEIQDPPTDDPSLETPTPHGAPGAPPPLRRAGT
ncbi:hypothetical protein GCM10023100_13570 [Actinocorallia cavernae]|uniref:Uncharacterized protein n=2 Tax=Actinomycetes TaxID=1760 RepID=A0ABN3MNX0_9ACTN